MTTLHLNNNTSQQDKWHLYSSINSNSMKKVSLNKKTFKLVMPIICTWINNFGCIVTLILISINQYKLSLVKNYVLFSVWVAQLIRVITYNIDNCLWRKGTLFWLILETWKWIVNSWRLKTIWLLRHTMCK